ncbi:SDR family NAD(P)-dependent oxidoreductase [Porticoccaceae bacterium]|jgi:NAD(P)-dependent dehydrogenase (short-subunit alcohol dehydrogenase family)|nr:SDR family NAD(P)-dependent oxidoreductase [Porticoccaceae bacterium]MBT7905199.1 SDR family NAD(P)-dependent oxidoreductase [Porticoccaceae bacterium]MDA8735507.1 SDR family NAD(P)-dependent oxidoreductase [Porticoccaceae bacterium]MDG1199162.1 SDR family NAD(P)-dependent oxidoreductase [Porticoccaceae bacterium]
MSTAATRNVLVLGAGGGLGQALIARFLSDPEVGMVIAVSRSGQTKDLSAPWLSQSRLVWIQSQYDEQSMLEVVGKLAPYAGTFSRVCICHGILHDDHLWPEKRFEDIDASAMLEIFQANTITPSLWLKVLHKTLASKLPCIVAVFSARVGSTSDNRLGGWYSYRASKAALNSLLKSFAVEYARRLKNVKLIAFHPGTVDTDLSKPFQASVPEQNLFSAVFVADQLAEIMASADLDGQLSYLDWDGKSIQF